jgi:hypothetical protein
VATSTRLAASALLATLALGGCAEAPTPGATGSEKKPRSAAVLAVGAERAEVLVTQPGDLAARDVAALERSARAFGETAAAYLGHRGPLAAVAPARATVRRELAALREATSPGGGGGRLLRASLTAASPRAAIAQLEILTPAGTRPLTATLELARGGWRAETLLAD